jgi:hypothetical protein
MNDDEGPPPELEQLDKALRDIRFVPRASLGPELLGRLRRGEGSKGDLSPWRRHPSLVALAASLILAAGTGLILRHPADVVVDRCCYDLDGGGDRDDGVLVRAQRDATVHRLQVYEDRDRSGTFSAGDLVRLDRGTDPAMHRGAATGLVTTEHCCLDFDGGGPDDDALLVIGVPPDRVLMAAIYERRVGRGSAPDAFPLR